MTANKILHVATDNKFIDYAHQIFERALPGGNDVFIIDECDDLQFVTLTPTIQCKAAHVASLLTDVDLAQYRFVVLHSLKLEFEPVIDAFKGTPICWLGWGYDYYDMLGSELDFLAPKTRRFQQRFLRLHGFKQWIKRGLRLPTEVARHDQIAQRIKLIEKIQWFSPVLEEEYELLLGSHEWGSFPAFISWNYGTLEDNYIKGFEGKVVQGTDIFIGNSASVTSNHLDAIEALKQHPELSRQIYVPLNYGTAPVSYKDAVVRFGVQCFGKAFTPLLNFMPIQEYVALLLNCGYVILNHKRQQAVGNIVILLYLGARIFLRAENPVYPHLIKRGVVINTMDELAKNPELLNTPLSKEERESNRQAMMQTWSRETGLERTQALIRTIAT